MQQTDSSRIEARKARFYFVPEGGSFIQTDTVIVDESTRPPSKYGIAGVYIGGHRTILATPRMT
jgi:hypothetical protein